MNFVQQSSNEFTQKQICEKSVKQFSEQKTIISRIIAQEIRSIQTLHE